MNIDKQGGKIAFVSDVAAHVSRLKLRITTRKVHELRIAAEKIGWHSRQQGRGKWHTACPKCATDDWKL